MKRFRKKEILVDYDKDLLLKIGNRMKLGKSVSMFQELEINGYIRLT